jgi:hypothetical protein
MTPAKRTALDLHAVVELPAGQAWESDEERASALRALNRVRASIHDDDWSKKVFAFHRLYRVPVGAKGSIHQLDAYRRTLRRRLLEEEFQETLAADASNDIVETIDGLLDTIYVAIGWLIELGMTPEQINVCMEEVHASNLTKVDNNGQPIFDDGGKVLKGNNYVKADIPAVLGDALPSGL